MLLHGEKDTILVACGYPDFVPLLQAAAMKHGITLDSLRKKLIVTHHDMDHNRGGHSAETDIPAHGDYRPLAGSAVHCRGEKIAAAGTGGSDLLRVAGG